MELNQQDYVPLATYDKHEGFYFVVSPSDRGPALSVLGGDFLFNGYFEDESWSLCVTQGESINNLKIYEGENSIFKLDYLRPPLSSWDYASDDEMEDILLWVSRHKGRSFAECWTVSYEDSCLSFFDQVKK